MSNKEKVLIIMIKKSAVFRDEQFIKNNNNDYNTILITFSLFLIMNNIPWSSFKYNGNIYKSYSTIWGLWNEQWMNRWSLIFQLEYWFIATHNVNMYWFRFCQCKPGMCLLSLNLPCICYLIPPILAPLWGWTHTPTHILLTNTSFSSTPSMSA